MEVRRSVCSPLPAFLTKGVIQPAGGGGSGVRSIKPDYPRKITAKPARQRVRLGRNSDFEEEAGGRVSKKKVPLRR